MPDINGTKTCVPHSFSTSVIITMKIYYIPIFLVALLTIFCDCRNQNSRFADCPMEGRAKPGGRRSLTDREMELNRYKNADPVAPKDKEPVSLDLATIVGSSAHSDEHEYANGTFVTTEARIVKYTEEGPESCNCYEADKADHDGDVHVYLSTDSDVPLDQCMVAEITPEFKKLHPDYDKMLQRGQKVRVTGYLLYDFMHERNAANNCSSCDEVWRKTCWEIHPVVSIDLTE